MHTEKPKRGMRTITWALVGLVLMVMSVAGIAFFVGMTANETDCSTRDDPQNNSCSETYPNQPATLTRFAEEAILTKAVHMVMPTATTTKQPTLIPVTPIPTKKMPPPTRTPVNSIRMAAAPIIALSECELKDMIDEAGSLVEKLDAYYEDAGGPNNRVARGATLNGPTVFWMKVASGEPLPENVIPIYSEAEWSVYLIREGNYTISIGEGGRYITLIVENECPLFE